MSDFCLYFGGAEQVGWRRLLAEQDAAMSLSFKGLLRRMPKSKPYRLAEQLAGEFPLLLDSGAHSFNSAKTGAPARDDLISFAQRYEAFVEENHERPRLISEFDSLHLGREWVEERREAFYDHLEPAKFMPVWHAEWGIQALRDMATKYEVIALTATETVTGSNLAPVLDQITRSGVRLHGVAMTKPDVLRVLPLSSAASTSWLSPSQYGDTIVWDGTSLHRYPRDAKERARRQHSGLFERAGFDTEKILADDPTEILRFTIWSWLRQAEAIQSMRGRRTGVLDPFGERVSDVDGAQLEPANAQEGGSTSDTRPPKTANSIARRDAIREPQEREERVMLPVVGMNVIEHKETDSEGQEITTRREFLTVANRSERQCNNCYLADVCTQFRPDHSCAYDIPVSAESAEQRRAIMQGVIKMQTQRVSFLKMAEDLNGGYADPNLSTEMDRLSKLMLAQHEIEDDRDSFEMTVRAKGARATTLERIFGAEAPPRHDATPIDPIKVVDSHVVLKD